MSQPRPGMAGATRTCPHCKTTILESASICPSCKHYLRFDEAGAAPATPRISPLQVEGTIRHPPDGGAWEYSMVLTIRNEFGKEINRQVVGVGGINPNEQRTFTLAVELVERRGVSPSRRSKH